MIDTRKPGRRDSYLSVGRFAQAVLLSRKALRLYNELGILEPIYVDPESGYRYYSTDQLEKARLIRMLRAMDMPLANVQSVLDAKTPDEAAQLIIDCRSEFELKAEQVRRASLKVLAYIRKEKDTMSVEVSVKTFPACQAIGIKKNITIPAFHEFIPIALLQLKTYIEESEVTISGDPICFYYGPVNENDDGPVEICYPVQGSIVPSGEIIVHEIPLHQGAIGTATPEQSRFPAIIEVWEAVVSWVQDNKFQMSEEAVACYEIWHEDTVSIVQPFESND